jgi:hypothetical protein
MIPDTSIYDSATLGILTDSYQRFEVTCFFQLQDRRNFLYPIMRVTCSSKLLAPVNKMTWIYNSDDHNLNTHHSQEATSHKSFKSAVTYKC